MKSSLVRIFVILLAITSTQVAFAQTNKEKALEKGMEAIKLMDNGKFEESINLLEEASKLDPEKYDYHYEIAYAYYTQQKYKEAIKQLEKYQNDKGVSDRSFQLLGNSYDNIGKGEKALEIYEQGLKKFPMSGNLHLEMGINLMNAKNYDKAIYYFEKGIEVAPKFPSNYYWAAKLFCSSTEEVWGMIYGELFMNLERNSKRTPEISKLLYDTYKNQIHFDSDTSMSVSFSKNATMNINDLLKDGSKLKLPFGVGVYEPTLLISTINIKSINLNSLDTIRKNFIVNYFSNKHDKNFPNVLFSYQKDILDAGHIEAYNHWILMKGDVTGFEKWEGLNKEKWAAFIKWFSNNGIVINDSNKFYRNQY